MVTLDMPFGFGVLKGLRIPAGEKNHVVTESFTLPEAVELVGLAPHAHYIATSMRADATLPDGRTLTLISIPRWDFAWQEQYRFTEPLHLPKGTRLDMAFHYDNSVENPYNPNNPPKEITFGPETTDEMACMTMAFTSESAETMTNLKQGYVAWVKEGVKTADLGILARSANEQRRDALDLNSDGTISIGEVIQRIKTVRRRMANPDPNSLHLQILPVMGARILRSVVLPWLLPRVAVAVAVLVMVIYLIRRLRRARRKKLHDDGLPQGA
jgi:hypothetical protein